MLATEAISKEPRLSRLNCTRDRPRGRSSTELLLIKLLLEELARLLLLLLLLSLTLGELALAVVVAFVLVLALLLLPPELVVLVVMAKGKGQQGATMAAASLPSSSGIPYQGEAVGFRADPAIEEQCVEEKEDRERPPFSVVVVVFGGSVGDR